MDDMTVFNDSQIDLNKNFHKMYNKNLNLKKINTKNDEANVLDLNISLQNEFHVKLYDKTRQFDFYCPKYPHYMSNLSHNVKLNCLYSQLFEICINQFFL